MMTALELAALSTLLTDAIDAAVSYAAGKTDPAEAQAAFAAACTRHAAAVAAWQQAEKDNPATS
jgi:hypothetical protein